MSLIQYLGHGSEDSAELLLLMLASPIGEPMVLLSSYKLHRFGEVGQERSILLVCMVMVAAS